MVVTTTGKRLSQHTFSPGRTPETPLRWQDDALCAQTDPDLFTADGKGVSLQEAKKVCASCTVAEQCLQYALDNDLRDSVYGGLSPRQRRQIQRKAAA